VSGGATDPDEAADEVVAEPAPKLLGMVMGWPAASHCLETTLATAALRVSTGLHNVVEYETHLIDRLSYRTLANMEKSGL
jgi:hypothetical protein